MESRQIPAVVRRVIGRVFAERGRTVHPAGRPESAPRAGGVHVELALDGQPARPVADRPAKGTGGPRANGGLLTADALLGVPDGGTLYLAPGTRTTPLVEEEAHRRRITLRVGSGTHGGEQLLVAIGADHGGYERKTEVGRWLVAMGHRVLDLGTHDENPVDYPDFARAVAEAVAEGRADLGICVDGAGIGSAMAANKVPGVLAATCTCVAMAKNAREHNFANVLCLGGKMQTSKLHEEIVRAFLTTPEGAPRHEKRVRKILEIERRYTRVGRELTRVRPGGENA